MERIVINGIYDDMMTEIIREWNAIKKTNEITSEQVLCQTIIVKEQGPQKVILDATKESKEFDAI